ncbi:hypothetical protein [Thermocatellispora tengchongensis]|uniref:hypothetical protein n=1 Tax=Thermocatellispora tengchongensis TaxID=1073253 RepID=UPI00362C42D3
MTGAVGLVAALLIDARTVVVGAVAGVAAGVLACVSLIAAAIRVGPGHRRTVLAWRWLASGAFAWMLGVGLRPVAGDASFTVTFADLPLITGAMLLAVGCYLTAGPPPHGRAVLRHVTDAYLCAASLFVMSWVVALGPLYRDLGESAGFALPLAAPMLCLLAACAVGPGVVVSRSSAWPVGLAGLAVLAAVTTGEMATAVARVGATIRRWPGCGWRRWRSCCSPPRRGAGAGRVRWTWTTSRGAPPGRSPPASSPPSRSRWWPWPRCWSWSAW